MSKWKLFAVAAVGALLTAVISAAAGPSGEQIAAALNLRAGTQMTVVVGGARYEVQYLHVEARREGEYALVFRLLK